ncbi:MAG: XdhC family protein [Chloracidobacterium sp.]|nr:XdhC family protein [Chloracidobacterium sp.]
MKTAMWNDIMEMADKLRADGEPFVIATVVAYKSPQSAKPGSKAIIKPDGSISGWIGGGCVQPIVIRAAQEAISAGKPKLINISEDATGGDWREVEAYPMTCHGGGSLEIYLEPVLPKPNLLIVGNSPVAQILTGLGRLLDFKVFVADPDAEREQFPEADVVLTDLESLKGRIDSRSFVVVATMGNGDEEGLEAVIGTQPQYIGLVSSKEKGRSLFQYIRDKGTPDEDISRVKCPAGLKLRGESMPEIALSVMAEITQLRRTVSEQTLELVKRSKDASLPEMEKSAEPLTDSAEPPTDSAEPPTDSAEFPTDSIDPVCGMTVATVNALYKTVFAEKTVYFCGLRCKVAFERTPKNYQYRERN